MCKKDNSLCFAIGILAGVVGGIAAGILFAPKSGEESRRELKDAYEDLMQKYSPEITQAKKQAMEMIKSSKEKIEDTYKKFNDNIKAQKLAHAKNCEIDVYEI